MSVVTQLDMITTVVDDPDAVFARLRDDFGLPVLWELYDAGPYRSGAVRMGNVSIEVLQRSNGDSPPVVLSFHPASLAGLGAELDNRQVHHGGVVEVHGKCPDGSEGLLHTEVVLQGDFAGPSCRVRVREPGVAVSPTGGSSKAGIHGIERVRIGTDDGAATIETWQRFLVPTRFDGAEWTFEHGPAVGIEAAESVHLVGFFLEVGSVDTAAATLGVEASTASSEGVDVGSLRFFLY